MKEIISILLLAVLAIALMPLAITAGKQLRRRLAANSLTHPEGVINLAPSAAITTLYLLGKRGASASLVAVCGAADLPLCVIQDTADAANVTAGDVVACRLLGAGQGTDRCVASEEIAIDADLYTAANGKVQNEPAIAGTYYKIGRALAAASGDGIAIPFDPCEPIKLVVVAALTSTNGTAGAAGADLPGLAAEAEKIGDDVRAIAAALATPALVKVLAA